MKVIIIEDEPLLAEALSIAIRQEDPDIQIQETLPSIRVALDYFQQHPEPDLFFSDIQLSDGLSFEIFKRLTLSAPVIFCTAFDQYALEAFKANGIDYLLKPFNQQDIRNTLNKFKQLRTPAQDLNRFQQQILQLESLYQSSSPQSILVKTGDRILPVKVEHIALANLENGTVYLYTFTRERIPTDLTLDGLSQSLNTAFFRVNRQSIIHRDAIKHVSQHFARKLLIEPVITIKTPLIISKANASAFLTWLQGT